MIVVATILSLSFPANRADMTKSVCANNTVRQMRGWITKLVVLLLCLAALAVVWYAYIQHSYRQSLLFHVERLSPGMTYGAVKSVLPSTFVTSPDERVELFYQNSSPEKMFPYRTVVASTNAVSALRLSLSSGRTAEGAELYFDAHSELVAVKYSSSGYRWIPKWGIICE